MRYILARSMHSSVLVFLAIVAVFLVVRILPGDPVTALTGDFPIPPEYAEEVRRAYGLDQPLPQQLVLYIAALARGDLGFSFKNQKPVSELLLQRGVNTLILGGFAFALGNVLGFLFGVIAAVWRTSPADVLIRLFAAGSYAAPTFWIGQLMILLLAVHLRLLPVSGMGSVRGVSGTGEQALDLLRHMVMPAVVMALPIIAVHARVLRVSMIDALTSDYVRTARAKGLSEKLVVFRHALRNALLPLVTITALEIPRLLTGAVLVETVFSWPGLGRLLFDSISSRDYPVIESMLLLVTLSVIAANWTADLMYSRIDPRVSHA